MLFFKAKKMTEVKAKVTIDASGAINVIQDVNKNINQLTGKTNNVKIGVDTSEAESKTKSFFSDLKEQASGLSGALDFSQIANFSVAGLATTAITGALSVIGDAFGDAVNKGKEFEQSLAGLSAITGVSGKDLDKFGESAKELSNRFGGSANSQVQAFQGILSKIGPQLAETPDALNKVTENINLLAKASGLDAKVAMDSLVGSMLQFGVDTSNAGDVAAKSSRFLNVMAASAKAGSAEIPQVAEAIKVAGTVANASNISFEEMNSAIQVLGTGSVYGAQAGTALRNSIGLLTKQSGEGDKVLKTMGLTTLELGTTMREKGLGGALEQLKGGFDKLKNPVEKAQALTQLFGQENSSAVSILLKNTDTMNKWTKEITGTNEGVIQASVNMNTFGESISRAGAYADNVKLDLFKAIAPALGLVTSKLFEFGKDVFESLKSALAPLMEILEPIIKVIGFALLGAFELIKTSLTNTFNIIGEVFGALRNAFDPIIVNFNNLFNAISSGSGTTTSFFDILKNVSGVVSELIGFFANLIASILQPMFGIIGGLIGYFAKWIGVTKDVGSETQKSKGFLDKLNDTLTLIRGTIGGLTESFLVIRKAIGDFFNALGNFDFKKALDSFTDIGKKAKDGFTKGFNDTVGKIEKPKEAEFKETPKKVEDSKGNLSLQDEDKKKKEAQESELQRANKQIAELKKINQEKEKALKIDLESQALSEGRTTLNEQEQLKLATLKSENSKNELLNAEKLLKVKKDEKGEVIGIGLKLAKKESKSDVILSVKNLQNDLQNDENAKLKLSVASDNKNAEIIKKIYGEISKNKQEIDKNNAEKEISDLKDKLEVIKNDTLLSEIEKAEKTLLITTELEQKSLQIKLNALEIKKQADIEKLLNEAKGITDLFEKEIAITNGRKAINEKYASEQLELEKAKNDKIIDLEKKVTEAKKKEEAERLALFKGITDAFLTAFSKEEEQKTAKAKEEADKRIDKAKDEQAKLDEQYKKGKLSYNDYIDKKKDIDKNYEEAKKSQQENEPKFVDKIQKGIVAGFKFVTDKKTKEFKDSTKEVEKSLDEEGKVTEKTTKLQEKAFGDLTTATAANLFSLLASGENVKSAVLQSLADMASKSIDLYIPQIMAIFTASIPPPFGTIAGFSAIGLVKALLASAVGAEDGVIGIDSSYNKKAGKTDTIPLMVAKGESIINAQSTAKYRPLLEAINKGMDPSYLLTPNIQPRFINNNGISDNKDMLGRLDNIERAVYQTAFKHKQDIEVTTSPFKLRGNDLISIHNKSIKKAIRIK